MRSFWFHRVPAHLLAALLLSLFAIATARAEILEEVSYVDHRGAAAIKLVFSEEIRYESYSPRRAASVYSIRFRFANKDMEDRSFPKEVLKPSMPPGVNVRSVVFTTDNIGPKVLLTFSKFVVIEVVPGPGSHAITVRLPDVEAAGKRGEARKRPEKPVVAGDETPPKKLMRLGKEALRTGKNGRAVQFFTKLVSLKDAATRREATELLGVARERNGQPAHAKAVYEDYIRTWPKGEDTDRVRQRLADLIAFEMRPKKKLKKGKRDKLAKKSRSDVFGSVAQYFYYGENDIDESGNQVDQSLLVTQLSWNYRYRSENWDIRNFIYGSHEYDFVTDTNENFELSNLYSDIKNTKVGFYAKLGRQSGSSGGVLGRFDGIALGYDLFKNVRTNIVAGYPVELTNKDSVVTDREFRGINIEFVDIITNLDFSPYYIQQDIFGITDRVAAGYELRYFHPKGGNFFNLVDYDTYFDEMNIMLLRGQLNFSDKTSLNLNYDYRRSPLLMVSNASLGNSQLYNIEDLLDPTLGGFTEEELMQMALERTGEATSYTIGLTRQPSDHLQLNMDFTRAEQVSYNDDGTGTAGPAPGGTGGVGTITETRDKQDYYSLQAILSRLFNGRDTYVLGLRYADTFTYESLTGSMAARVPFKGGWRFDFQYSIDRRESSTGEILDRNRPTLKLEYNLSRNMSFQLQYGMEWWKFSGVTANQNYTRTLANMGYRWTF